MNKLLLVAIATSVWIVGMAQPASAARCSDFATQQDAQAHLDQTGDSRLDRDRDGIACETLPSAPARVAPSPQRPATPRTPSRPAPVRQQEQCGETPRWIGQVTDSNREVAIARLGLAFSVPADYRVVAMADGVVHIVDPDVYVFLQCEARGGNTNGAPFNAVTIREEGYYSRGGASLSIEAMGRYPNAEEITLADGTQAFLARPGNQINMLLFRVPGNPNTIQVISDGAFGANDVANRDAAFQVIRSSLRLQR